MFKKLKNEILRKMISKSMTTEGMLEREWCYVRVTDEGNVKTYLATSNPDIAIEVVDEIELVGIDLSLDLGWALNEFDTCVDEPDGTGKCIIRMHNKDEGMYIDVSELDLKAVGVEVVPASEIIKKHSDIAEALKAEKVLITYYANGKHEVLHTSLSNKSLFSWVYNGSGREVYQVQQYFKETDDIGVVVLPDLDAKYPSYRRINLLDVINVEVVD